MWESLRLKPEKGDLFIKQNVFYQMGAAETWSVICLSKINNKNLHIYILLIDMIASMLVRAYMM